MQNDLWTWDLYLTCYNLREILSVYRCMDHFKNSLCNRLCCYIMSWDTMSMFLTCFSQFQSYFRDCHTCISGKVTMYATRCIHNECRYFLSTTLRCTVHWLHSNTCQGESILKRRTLTFSQQAAPGFQLCSRFSRADSALLPLVPDWGEERGNYPEQGQLHGAVQGNVEGQKFCRCYLWIITLEKNNQETRSLSVTLAAKEGMFKCLWDTCPRVGA